MDKQFKTNSFQLYNEHPAMFDHCRQMSLIRDLSTWKMPRRRSFKRPTRRQFTSRELFLSK